MSFLDVVNGIGEEQAQAKEGAASAAPAAPSRERKPTTGDGDPEIQAMLQEAPLIELIRADTNEIGKQHGDYVAFEHCPICGHENCFRYYPTTNSWACFSESNGTGYKGASYLEYQQIVHGMDTIEAVKALREATGHPYEGSSGEPEAWYDFDGNLVTGKPGAGKEDAGAGSTEAPKLLLPPWEQVRAVDPPKRAPVLIDGILRRGHVMLIAGKAKTGKSWAAIEASIAVSTGGDWFGRCCDRGRVLYVDPELDKRSLDNRFAKVSRAMGADPAAIDENVVRWSLRGVTTPKGVPATIADVAHDVEARCKPGDFALVVLDSASALLDGGDENSSVDVRRFFNHVLRIARATGASVIVVHHFGKGEAGDRTAIDRARGSSVWGDSPDAPLSLTEIYPKEGKPADYLADRERAFVLEDSGLREFPSIEPLHIIFSHPVHRVDVDGITSEWKPRTSQGKGGKKTGDGNRSKSEARADRCVIALLAVFVHEGIGGEGMPANEAAEAVSDAIGETVKPATLKRYIEASDVLDVWQKSPRRWLVVPRRPPSKEPEAATLDL